MVVHFPRQALLDTFALGLLIGDAGLCASVYAPNAVIVPPERGLIYGRPDIRDYWQRVIDEGCRANSVIRDKIEGRDDQLTEHGCYVHFEHPVSLDKYSAWGSYVLVWERQANGSWAWAADTWNDMSVRSA